MLLPHFHRQIRALSWLVIGMLSSTLVSHAQTVSAPSLVLKPSSLLQETLSRDMKGDLPTYVQSDSLSGQNSFQSSFEGGVIIRRGDLLIKADKVDYDQESDVVHANGHVYVNRAGNIYSGPTLKLNLDSFEGFFTQPAYQFSKNKAHGTASRIDFIDEANSTFNNATYTTCQRKPGPNWVPDWFFEGSKISIDSDRNVGKIEDGAIHFMGTTGIPVPAMEFPVAGERKSGLLAPTIGSSTLNGLEITQPYYVNLAPNRDITFFPTEWARRGLGIGTEFRYLEGLAPQPPFQGLVRLDYLNNDLQRQQPRWRFQANHLGLINPGYAGGSLGFSLNIHRVSDQNYWKDFTTVPGSASPTGIQRLLSNDSAISWTNGIITTSLLVQQWQTLQDLTNVDNRITAPFDRLPQVGARVQRNDIGGFDFSVDTQVSRFQAVRDIDCLTPNSLYCAPNASRSVAWAQMSRPFLTPYSYITPKVQLHARSYSFDGGLPNHTLFTSHVGESTASVALPTFSIDSGMAFDRESRLFGRTWEQTLEPRLFYVNSPYRDQNFLPNYDSGGNAFNFSSVFTENAFGGHDRISDSNMLTMGLTSRFIDPVNGSEGARFGIAQRLRFRDQFINLPGDPAIAKAGVSDVLVGATINLQRAWALDSTLQYNPSTANPLRQMVAGRYSPGAYRVFNAAYRAQNNASGEPLSRQLDLGWQWPLHDLWGGKDDAPGLGRGLGEGRWYSLARMNFSTLDRRLVDSVIGFEYDAGCWLGRAVVERTQITESLSSQRLLFQLELIGLSNVGTNALGSLRTNVPRYQRLRQPVMPPSRFGSYD